MPSVQRAALSVPSRVPKMLRLLPFHRPASPELKLSPSATIAVVDDAGPADAEGALPAFSYRARGKSPDQPSREGSKLAEERMWSRTRGVNLHRA